ncbi:glycoside hydrolase family 30 beta sandwich domain-containing protein [Actinomyces sp. 565]|uniref:glycoside hydrolase family 30 protein n=1 Tax=Actinomyces sp. 565 TaxID=2057794 RepID=UPI0013A6DE19|nr:glycoside hydrolase family 30 beta sandwich domain-containing protein [Actinomyces sp. 565]NDR54119.1 beta-glycosidase [Actinomyces sp. 565]
MTDTSPANTPAAGFQFYATTEADPWFTPETPVTIEPMQTFPGAFLRLDAPAQEIDGFGVCFNELGWVALSRLSEAERSEVLRQVFAPGVGTNLTVCRMPVGANDFATDWYSYDEVDGDFALEHFSVEHDDATLVPYIQAAKAHRPDLTLWASPWGPPSWFKRNKHYACAAPNPMSEQTAFDNGLSPDNQIEEGTDGLILTEEVLDAYARYFGKFIDAYAERGIDISMVMPQNEFNSAQIYPACTWTPEGLIAFLKHLVPEMERRGVKVFFGTMERPDDTMVEKVLADPEVGPHIAGVGFQWDGKRAVPFVHHNHPELKIYQSEQECGDGKNDWRYARYAWTMMRHYFNNGASVYDYWNLALDEGGVSRWGWSQNSLVTVDPATGKSRFTYEYYVLRHLSGFVQPGARFVPALSYTGYENLLAFHNPDGSVVVAAQNDMTTPQAFVVGVGNKNVSFTAPADSLVTVVVPAEHVEVAAKPLA